MAEGAGDNSASKRILTGLQPSGQLHLGNYAGAIVPLLRLQEQSPGNVFVFVASYHAMTSVHDAEALRTNIRQVVVDYLAFGLDPEKVTIYRQQDVPQVTELAWLLGCVCPKSQMDKQVAFKDKVAKGISASLGLYSYPVLQAADILAVDADLVPVGQDQKQNLEIARDLAEKFNRAYGPTFKVPNYTVRAEAGVLPGVDGEKMSKSYGNTIDPFLPEKKLRKTIMKIVTDSTPVEEAKDVTKDTTYAIYRAFCEGESDPRLQALQARYAATGPADPRSGGSHPGGGMGYGEAKQALFELLMDHFGPAREKRESLMSESGQKYVDDVLLSGAAKAREVIGEVTERARTHSGL